MSDRDLRDWDAVRRRLEDAEKALSNTGTPTREEMDRVFRKRAEELARPLSLPAESRTENILVFRAGGVRFGMPLTHIAEVVSNPKIAKVPGAPSEIAGLIQVRGDVRPVWNLPALLGLNTQDAAPSQTGQILLLRHAAQEIGILADSIENTAQYDSEKIRQSPGNLPGTRITDDFVTVLDVKTLFARFQGSITI